MISERKLKILTAIISDFTETSSPVGSATISKKYKIGFSAATIRNEMADLEHLGLLIQPHTSAGRIPSDLGLRYFVNSLNEAFDRQVTYYHLKEEILNELRNKTDVSEVAKYASKILERLTSLTSYVEMPRNSNSILQRVIFVKASESKVVMMIVTKSDEIKTIEIDYKSADEEFLRKVSLAITQNFTGEYLDLIDIRSVVKIIAGVSDESSYLIPPLKKAFGMINQGKGVLEGITKLVGVVDDESFKVVYEVLERGVDIEKLLKHHKYNTNKDVAILIGSEIPHPVFSNLAIIAHSYMVKGAKKWVFVIGNKNMDYVKNSIIVKQVATALEELYSAINL